MFFVSRTMAFSRIRSFATLASQRRNPKAGFRTLHEDSKSIDAILRQNIPGLMALSPRLRKSPYFEKTVEQGVCEFTVYNRMLMPLYYSEGFDVEYKALTEDVAVWDVAAERQVELLGPDAHKLAQQLTCRNISKIKRGKCVYAIMTDDDGIVVNDPVLLKLAEDRYWFSIADSDVVLWAKGIALGQNLDVKVFEPDVSPLAIQGPASKLLMSDLYGKEVVDRLKYFDFAHGEETMLLGKIPTLLARSGWSPELGYEIYLEDGSYGNELYDLVWKYGYQYGIKPGAPNQQRRIEGGMLSFGADTLQDTNALELGLPKKFVNPYGAHDFIGKKALQQIAEDGGPQRKLYGIMFDSPDEDENVEVLAEVWCGKHLGVFADGGASQNQYGVFTAFTSYSPQFRRALGFAFLPNDIANIGSDVFIETPDGLRVKGSVCSLPFSTRVA